MYANLQVESSDGGPWPAWKVEVDPNGSVRIFTDLQDGDGSYPEPGPVIDLPAGGTVTVRPDF